MQLLKAAVAQRTSKVTLAEIMVVANPTWRRVWLGALVAGPRDCSAAPGSTVMDRLDRVGDAGCSGDQDKHHCSLSPVQVALRPGPTSSR